MRVLTITFALGVLLLAASCEKEIETTGEVRVSFVNETLFNQEDFFVKSGIVFLESDYDVLIDFGKRDISRGRVSAEYGPVKLNPGNYYVRYQYSFNGGSSFGGAVHKPFQVQLGEETVVRIVR